MKKFLCNLTNPSALTILCDCLHGFSTHILPFLNYKIFLLCFYTSISAIQGKVPFAGQQKFILKDTKKCEDEKARKGMVPPKEN